MLAWRAGVRLVAWVLPPSVAPFPADVSSLDARTGAVASVASVATIPGSLVPWFHKVRILEHPLPSR